MIVSPYSYGWLNGQLTNYLNKGVKNITFAFVIDGAADFNSNVSDMQSFVKSGGNLTLSFGGADGTMIDQSITSDDTLYNTYVSLIQKSGCSRIDFDVEGANVAIQGANDRRNRVLVRLQASNKYIQVSYTLAADQNGLPSDVLKVISDAAAAGVRVDIVNGMFMDNGWSNTGASSCQGAKVLKTQTTKLFPNAKIGMTMMIGKNDDNSYCTIADANTVAAFAEVASNKVGLLSYWALQRDTVGSGDYNSYSLVNQFNLQFYNIFASVKTFPVPVVPVVPVIPVVPVVPVIPVVPVVPVIPVVPSTGVSTVLGHSIIQDQRAGWLKVDGVAMGDSSGSGYKTVTTFDIGGLLDTLIKDPNVVIVDYEWSSGKAYIKSNFNIQTSGDSILRPGFTAFIVKSKSNGLHV